MAADVYEALTIGKSRDEDEKMTLSTTEGHFGQRGGA
jgi:hypothetical protein